MEDCKISKLLNRWDNLCIICGEPFLTPYCITRDHIIARAPKCKPRNKFRRYLANRLGHNNVAPAHYRCNQLKGAQSLLVAVKLIEKMRIRLGKDFEIWLNKKVPRKQPTEIQSPEKS